MPRSPTAALTALVACFAFVALSGDARSAGPPRTAEGLALPIVYDGNKIDLGYRLDLLVADLVVVEVKAVESVTDIHRAQILSYLKLGGYRLGYLLNFNVKMLRHGISRLANGL